MDREALMAEYEALKARKERAEQLPDETLKRWMADYKEITRRMSEILSELDADMPRDTDYIRSLCSVVRHASSRNWGEAAGWKSLEEYLASAPVVNEAVTNAEMKLHEAAVFGTREDFVRALNEYVALWQDLKEDWTGAVGKLGATRIMKAEQASWFEPASV